MWPITTLTSFTEYRIEEIAMKKRLAPTLMIMGLVFSCAKEKSYDEVNKTSDLKFASAYQAKKTLLDMCTTDDPCLYAPSVTDTPYEVTASRPYWQGEQRLVITNIDKGKLQFLQIEDDARFDDNTNNLSPVLNVDVDHVDYKCSEDEFGDCTNKEEVDSDKSWKERRFVKIKDIEVVEQNTLPIELGAMFGDGCFDEIDQTVTKLDIVKDAINVKVRKTYKGKISCTGNITTWDELMEQLRYMTFSVDYAYSIVKLSTITDKNYVPVEYDVADENKFGFFKTTKKQKTVDNHGHYMGLKQDYINRWSPNKKEVVYHLNEDFYLPEMSEILKATENAITTVNNSLEKANADMKIILKKGENSDIGDLRKNFLVLVKDPQASGVIGYGPSVKNPRTGEIVNARTVMYYGSIQKYVGRAYDELVEEVIKIVSARRAEEQRQQQAQQNQVAQQENPAQNKEMVGSDKIMSLEVAQNFEYANFTTARADFDNLERIFNPEVDRTFDLNQSHQQQDPKKLYSEFKRKILNGENTANEMIARMSEQTFYHGSQVNYDDIVIQELLADVEAEKGIAFWDDLTEERRQYYMTKLLPYTWVPTLVHEFGHNLGLRHNFYGSTDTENFYSEAESQKLGMRKEVTYSSIMDYAPKTNNELKIMGKYDVAALRYAYAREDVTKEGKVVSLPAGHGFDKDIKLKSSELKVLQAEVAALEKLRNPTADQKTKLATLKDVVAKKTTQIESMQTLAFKKYKYCSDEHVDNDPLCNRHDEGTSYEGVVDYQIAQFKKNYERVNFRNRRFSYESRMGDYNYFSYLLGMFSEIYQFFAAYDGAYKNGLYDGDEWKENPILVDIKKASDKAFDFFMNIIEEPAYHCIEFDPKKGEIISIKPFIEMAKGTQLEKFGITFDIADGCMFLNSYGREGMGYAQFGKYLNNSIDVRIDKSQVKRGDTSQMDVRGMWQDKVIAVFFSGLRAMKRSTVGAASAGNFFDYPEYRDRLEKSLHGILTNTMVKEVEVTLPSGGVQKLAMPYTIESSHYVNQSFNWMVNGILGLTDNRTNLKSVMLRFLKMQLANDKEEGNIESEQAFADYFHFDVDKISTRHDMARYNYDKIIDFKNSKGEVNYRFGLYSYQKKGMELAKLKDDFELLQIADKKDLEMAQVIMNEEVISYLQTIPRLTEEDVKAIEEAGYTLEAFKASNKFTEEELGLLEQIIAAQIPHAEIKKMISGLPKFTKEELAQIASLGELGENPTSKEKWKAQIKMLKAAKVLEESRIADIKTIVLDISVDAVNGFVNGTLNQQVLLTSFLALSK